MSSSSFYRAFEERYYAPRDVIRELRKQYLPFVEPLLALNATAETFDIGCGRGEWLELMLELGLKPYGIDLDEGMLADCKALHLPATQGDAVAHLFTIPNESQVVVSAFHVVEHITYEQLRTVIREAFRVLKPGGLLIIETPNPENIVVATRNFYLDPTHQRPIPPLLLSFLTEHHGFSRNKIIRLQESKTLANNQSLSLNDVLGGASPDYAVVAQKEAAPAVLAKFEEVFSKTYGLELSELADRYDNELRRRIERIESHVVQLDSVRLTTRKQSKDAEARAWQTERDAILRSSEQQLKNAEERTRALETERDAILRRFEHQMEDAQARVRALEIDRENILRSSAQEIKNAEAKAHTLEARQAAILQSWSWRLSLPIRLVGGALIGICVKARQGFIAFLEKPLAAMMRVVLRNPDLSRRINECLSRYPRIRQRLLRVGQRAGLVSGAAAYVVPMAEVNQTDASEMTPRAREIYRDLKTAIEDRQKDQA